MDPLGDVLDECKLPVKPLKLPQTQPKEHRQSHGKGDRDAYQRSRRACRHLLGDEPALAGIVAILQGDQAGLQKAQQAERQDQQQGRPKHRMDP